MFFSVNFPVAFEEIYVKIEPFFASSDEEEVSWFPAIMYCYDLIDVYFFIPMQGCVGFKPIGLNHLKKP